MIFKALACDFDGTLALEDRIGAAARDALGTARAAALRLILVTGRTFFERTRVCDCLAIRVRSARCGRASVREERARWSSFSL